MYKILEGTSVSELEALVNEEARSGFVPIGGVCAVEVNDGRGFSYTTFYQAVELGEFA